MLIKIQNFIIILFLILFAFLLRVHNLDEHYADNDEFAQGLTAYSIIQNTNNINSSLLKNLVGFKVGDTYYESISIFSKIPYIYFFNLTIHSIRLASVINAVITIWLFYFFLKELLDNNSLKALIGTFLMTISIWHVTLSRLALQSINVPLFLILSTLFLIKYQKYNNMLNLILFSLFAGLGFYTYPTFAPMIFIITLLFLFLHRKFFFTINKKRTVHYMISVMLFLLIITPYLLNISDAMIRAKGENIFNEKFITESPFKVLLKNIFLHISPVQYFIYNPPNYYIHSPRLEYLILFPFFLIGIFLLFKNKNYFILGWWLIGSIIPSLTRIGVSINPNRAIILLPAIIIILLEGIHYVLSRIKFKKIFIILLIITLIIEMFIYFPKFIYNKYEYENFPQREAYTEDLLNKITTNFSDYNNIIIESCLNYIKFEAISFQFLAKHLYKSQLKGKSMYFCPLNNMVCLIPEKSSISKELYVLCSKNHQGFIYLDQISRKTNATDVQYNIAVLNQSYAI